MPLVHSSLVQCRVPSLSQPTQRSALSAPYLGWAGAVLDVMLEVLREQLDGALNGRRGHADQTAETLTPCELDHPVDGAEHRGGRLAALHLLQDAHELLRLHLAGGT